MRFAALAALLLALPLMPTDAMAQDMDAHIAAQKRRAERYPLGHKIFKEGKKKLKEQRKAFKKADYNGWKDMLEVKAEQMKEASNQAN